MTKRALLIGINRYKIPGADLRGCVNDVNNIKGLLIDAFGFPKSGIKTVTDLRATTLRIRTEIEKLIQRAKTGDVILLHYAGHGASVPDKNGDEEDGRDEILCPTDLNWYDPLTDDWLRDTFDGVAAGVNFTVIMDCCHSGSNTREVRDPNAETLSRFLPCPLDSTDEESGRSVRGKTRAKSKTKAKKTKARKKANNNNVVEVDIPEVLISGCRDDQLSADAMIDGSYNGAMTYSLVYALKSLTADGQAVTYRKLHTEMLELLEGSNYAQKPQLEGRKSNLDHPFLEPY